MANGQIAFFSDALDDNLLPDGIPEFSGGQFSNWRANLLKPNQSKELLNADVDSLGRVRTRRGTTRVGSGTAGTGTLIQGLTSYQTPDYNYIVAANGAKIWKFDGVNWIQIATGGTVDNADILIARIGAINNAGGYPLGTTVLTVDGFVGVVGVGEKLYFINNLRTDYFEYTIAAHTETAGNTTQIVLESPGLVFDVDDNWQITVLRPAAVNNGAGYPAGATTIAIDGYTGVVNVGEKFVIKSENINHTVTAVTPPGPATTTGITFTPGLQADWAATNSTVSVVFAQGVDKLFFCDGVGPIYSWDGKTLGNLSNASLLDELSGTYSAGRTKPPATANILVWFQSRLIASGIPTEPDTVYFSDFLDATSWDKDYQSLRVGGGESDPITGLIAWTDLNMLVTKKNSIYLVDCDPAQNPDPTDPTALVASFAIKKIHGLIGCPAPLTAVQVGGGSSSPGSDVFFLDGDKKLRSIRRVLATETQQEIGDALSLPVQDLLDEVNIQYINRCVAYFHHDHYLLAYPDTDSTYPNVVLVYNLLTQSWCGHWDGWAPTYFARRTDLGNYSKLIFGQGVGDGTGVNGGTVFQWLDDVDLDDETNATYQDNGVDIDTRITTRAMTLGDPFSFKTGLSVEFEFDESISHDLVVQVILDQVPHPEIIAPPFSTLSQPQIRLPVIIAFTLAPAPSLRRWAFDLQRYGSWRELQFMLTSESTKMSIRSIRITGFMDTIQLQTVPLDQPIGPFTPPDSLVTTGIPGNPQEAVTGDDGLGVTVGS